MKITADLLIFVRYRDHSLTVSEPSFSTPVHGPTSMTVHRLKVNSPHRSPLTVNRSMFKFYLFFKIEKLNLPRKERSNLYRKHTFLYRTLLIVHYFFEAYRLNG